MYKFHGALGKRQDEQPIPEDQFVKRRIDYARFMGSLGKRFDQDEYQPSPSMDKRAKFDRYMFAPSLGKRFDDNDETMAADKRRMDRFAYFGNLGKRGMDRLAYFGTLGKRGFDRHAFFGSLGKRAFDRHAFFGSLGKRRIDRLAYFGGLGKRNGVEDERYTNNIYDDSDFDSSYESNYILPARETRSWLRTSRSSKRLPVAIRGIDKYSLFGSLGKRSIVQELPQET